MKKLTEGEMDNYFNSFMDYLYPKTPEGKFIVLNVVEAAEKALETYSVYDEDTMNAFFKQMKEDRDRLFDSNYTRHSGNLTTDAWRRVTAEWSGKHYKTIGLRDVISMLEDEKSPWYLFDPRYEREAMKRIREKERSETERERRGRAWRAEERRRRSLARRATAAARRGEVLMPSKREQQEDKKMMGDFPFFGRRRMTGEDIPPYLRGGQSYRSKRSSRGKKQTFKVKK